MEFASRFLCHDVNEGSQSEELSLIIIMRKINNYSVMQQSLRDEARTTNSSVNNFQAKRDYLSNNSGTTNDSVNVRKQKVHLEDK